LRVRWPSQSCGRVLAVKTILSSGGWAEDASDAEIVDGITLAGRDRRHFTETAGGVTVASARKLMRKGASIRTRPLFCASPATD